MRSFTLFPEEYQLVKIVKQVDHYRADRLNVFFVSLIIKVAAAGHQSPSFLIKEINAVKVGVSPVLQWNFAGCVKIKRMKKDVAN